MTGEKGCGRKREMGAPVERVSRRALLGLGGLLLTACGARPSPTGDKTAQRTVAPSQVKEAQPMPTAIRERPIEPEWKHFRSPNYPYEIDYPISWEIVSREIVSRLFGGQKLDIFLGRVFNGFRTNVYIFTEPIKPWIRLPDYVELARGRINSDTQNKVHIVNDIDLPRKKIIDGQDAWLINAIIPETYFTNQPYFASFLLFVKDTQGWQISMAESLQQGNRYVSREGDTFEKMYRSFKFLQ